MTHHTHELAQELVNKNQDPFLGKHIKARRCNIEMHLQFSVRQNRKVGLLKCCLLFSTITKHSNLFLLNRDCAHVI